ncbi:MAG: HlyD family efflux transporter periplasmic adaptor subunit [Pirellulaceae bacterium]
MIKSLSSLRRRRVDRGQKLLTLVNPAGAWELELYLPEKRLWELREAQENLGDELTVSFELATLPGKVFQGTIVEVDRFASVQGGEGNSIAVRVRIERDDIPAEVRVAGARVVAKIEGANEASPTSCSTTSGRCCGAKCCSR